MSTRTIFLVMTSVAEHLHCSWILDYFGKRTMRFSKTLHYSKPCLLYINQQFYVCVCIYIIYSYITMYSSLPQFGLSVTLTLSIPGHLE